MSMRQVWRLKESELDPPLFGRLVYRMKEARTRGGGPMTRA